MNEKIPDIIVTSRVTIKHFRDFAIFDTLIRQRKAVSPLIFSAIFFSFSILCFLMKNKTQQAPLLGAVMIAIATVFPAVYFGNFFRSITKKSEELKLGTNGRHAYTIEFTDTANGIVITNAIQAQGALRLNWAQLFHAYRTRNCIYLYSSPRQAFLIPDGCANVPPDELWNYLKQKMTAEKTTDRRK